MWEFVQHMAYRGFLHWVAGGLCLLMVFFLLDYWMRRNRKVVLWVSGDTQHLLVTSGLIVALFASWREPYDIHNKQALIKAYTDIFSWVLGEGSWAWALYRFRRRRDVRLTVERLNELLK